MKWAKIRSFFAYLPKSEKCVSASSLVASCPPDDLASCTLSVIRQYTNLHTYRSWHHCHQTTSLTILSCWVFLTYAMIWRKMFWSWTMFWQRNSYSCSHHFNFEFLALQLRFFIVVLARFCRCSFWTNALLQLDIHLMYCKFIDKNMGFHNI